MQIPFFKSGKSKPESECDFEAIRSIFSKFRRIQKLNTRALGIMAEMERALGGEYIFDRAYLDRSVRDLSGLAYQVVYSLNALAGNRYIDLYDRFQAIKTTLEEVLAGGPGALASHLVLPFSELGMEMEPLAGTLAVSLAEVRNRLGLAAPDGFAVTVTGCRKFIAWNRLDDPGTIPSQGENPKSGLPVAIALPATMTYPPELEEAILRETESLFARRGGSVPLDVRACLAGEIALRQPKPLFARGVSHKALLEVCKQLLADFIAERLLSGMRDFSVALAVHESVAAHLSGSISSGPAGSLRIRATSSDPATREEIYLVQRVYPFDPIRSEVAPKTIGRELDSGTPALFHAGGILRRGSALLDPDLLKALAETSGSIERILGQFRELEWVAADGRLPVWTAVHPAGAGRRKATGNRPISRTCTGSRSSSRAGKRCRRESPPEGSCMCTKPPTPSFFPGGPLPLPEPPVPS